MWRMGLVRVLFLCFTRLCVRLTLCVGRVRLLSRMLSSRFIRVVWCRLCRMGCRWLTMLNM